MLSSFQSRVVKSCKIHGFCFQMFFVSFLSREVTFFSQPLANNKTMARDWPRSGEGLNGCGVSFGLIHRRSYGCF